MNWDYNEIIQWLKEVHRDIYDEWNLHIKDRRDREIAKLNAKVSEVQNWLNDLENHPRWKTQEDWRRAIQLCIDEINNSEDYDKRQTYWDGIKALAGRHPEFPTRRAVFNNTHWQERSEEE